jgi:hypothetical protein
MSVGMCNCIGALWALAKWKLGDTPKLGRRDIGDAGVVADFPREEGL